MAELQDQLAVSSRVEFASYLLLAALEDEHLEAETDADELAAVSYTEQTLHEVGR